ncbi:MAG: AAA family ATPase, partial [Lachnospiraceae bacterium]
MIKRIYFAGLKYYIDWETKKTYMNSEEGGKPIHIGHVSESGFDKLLFDLLIEEYYKQLEVSEDGNKIASPFLQYDGSEESIFELAVEEDAFRSQRKNDLSKDELLLLSRKERREKVSKKIYDLKKRFFSEYRKSDTNDKNRFTILANEIFDTTNLNENKRHGITFNAVYISEDDRYPRVSKYDPRKIEWDTSTSRSPETYVVKYRPDELKLLNYTLKEKRCLCLTGESGVGKSMLARTIASNYNGYMFWLSCENGKSFEDVICSLNDKWYPATNYDSSEDILEVLNNRTDYLKEWLIVFDNCNHDKDDFARDLNNFINRLDSTKNIKILITTVIDELIYESEDNKIHRVSNLKNDAYCKLWEDKYVSGKNPYKTINGKRELVDAFKTFRTIVRDNTYITCLVGSIIRKCGDDWERKLDEINDLLSQTRINENFNVAINRTDNEHFREENTLFGFMNNLLANHVMTDEELSIMESLALFPLDGVEYNVFSEIWKRDLIDIIEDLQFRHWITCSNNKIMLHPVAKSVMLHRVDKDGNKVFDRNHIKEFVHNFTKYIVNLREQSNYKCSPYVDTIYNCVYFLHPFGKEIYNKEHEALVEDEKKFLVRKNGTIHSEIKKWTALIDEKYEEVDYDVNQLAYLYTSLCEDTYLGPREHTFPTAACVIRYIKCRIDLSMPLQLRDYRWIQGSAYSFLHTDSKGLIKEEEEELAKKNLEYALNQLEEYRENLMRKKDYLISEDYYDCEIIRAMIHGNIAAYLSRAKGINKAYKEYITSQEIRENMLKIISDSEVSDKWKKRKDYIEKRNSLIVLCAKANENIGLCFTQMNPPNYKKALNYYKEAQIQRKSLGNNFFNDALMRNYLLYIDCFVRLTE